MVGTVLALCCRLLPCPKNAVLPVESVPRFLLRSLAVADNAFLLVWFANFSLWDLVVYLGLERMSAGARVAWMYARLAVYPLGFICQTATIWLTVLVAASRCLAVTLTNHKEFIAPKSQL